MLHDEDGIFVALCLELDVASQGATIDEAIANVKESAELLLETASEEEIAERLNANIVVAQFEAAVHA